MNILNVKAGDRYGKLIIVREVEKIDRHRRFECKCDCGNVVIAKINILRMGGRKSCGCLVRENAIINMKKKAQKAKGTTLQNGYLSYTNGPHMQRRVHDVIMEEKIGRRLTKKECVNHIN
jgi:hypothetical protein